MQSFPESVLTAWLHARNSLMRSATQCCPQLSCVHTILSITAGTCWKLHIWLKRAQQRSKVSSIHSTLEGGSSRGKGEEYPESACHSPLPPIAPSTSQKDWLCSRFTNYLCDTRTVKQMAARGAIEPCDIRPEQPNPRKEVQKEETKKTKDNENCPERASTPSANYMDGLGLSTRMEANIKLHKSHDMTHIKCRLK